MSTECKDQVVRVQGWKQGVGKGLPTAINEMEGAGSEGEDQRACDAMSKKEGWWEGRGKREEEEGRREEIKEG
eukprot:3648-Hanusia_phi.AAC.1